MAARRCHATSTSVRPTSPPASTSLERLLDDLAGAPQGGHLGGVLDDTQAAQTVADVAQAAAVQPAQEAMVGVAELAALETQGRLVAQLARQRRQRVLGQALDLLEREAVHLFVDLRPVARVGADEGQVAGPAAARRRRRESR